MISPQVGKARNHDLTPSSAKYLSHLKNVQTGTRTHPASYFMYTRGFLLAANIHSMKLTIQVLLVPWLRMSAALPELSPICLHGLDRSNCTYTYWSMWCHIAEGHSSYLLLYKPKLISEFKMCIILLKNTSNLSVPFWNSITSEGGV
jgi:hypothetical protein